MDPWHRVGSDSETSQWAGRFLGRALDPSQWREGHGTGQGKGMSGDGPGGSLGHPHPGPLELKWPTEGLTSG